MANTEPHVDSAGGSGEVMDRWKTDNCESGGDRLSNRSTSLSRRLIGLAGVAALTVGGAGAVLLGGGEAFAATLSTPTTYTNNFTVGTATVGGVTFSAASLAQKTATTYTVGFTVPSTETAASVVVSLSGLPDNATSGATFQTTVTDVSTGISYGVLSSNGFTAAAANTGGLTIPAGDFTAGDTMSVQIIGITNGATTSNPFTPTVDIPGYLPGSAAVVNLTGTTATSTLTVNPATAGGSATYTYSLTSGLGAPLNQIYVALSSPVTTSSAPPLGMTPAAFPSAASDYTVKDTTTGANVPLATTTPIIAFTGSDGYGTTSPSPAFPAFAEINLGTNTVASTDLLTVSVNGVVNPSPGGTYIGSVTTTAPLANPTTGESVDIGAGLTSATLAISPAIQGNSAAVYSVSFTVPANYVASATSVSSVFTDSNNTLIPTAQSTQSWAIFDATNSAADSAGSGAGSVPNFTTSASATGSFVAAGDSITIDYYNEVNTSAASVSATVAVGSQYSIPVTTNAVSLALPSTNSVYPTVSLGNATAGAVTTYTLGDFVVPTVGIPAGSDIPVVVGTGTGGMSTSFAPGTATSSVIYSLPFTFPANSVNYTLTDLTNSAASGVSGATTAPNTFTLTNTNALAAGDKIQITVTGVTNTTLAGTNYMFSVTGLGFGSIAASTPNAALSYPNGAFVQSGAQVDVIAGGVGFGIPTMTDYQQIAASDSSAVVSGSFPTATTVRTGTLLKVLGSPAIYVVGTNGEAYPFSTPTEFSSDGYSAMSVVNVPSLGSLTVGSGTAPTAAVTMPDGALVQSGSTIYVYAGGVAFGIPTFANYQTVAAATGTTVVQGTVSNTTGTALTAGTLVQPIGSAGIYVSYGNSLYQFSTVSQFSTDGYNGANVVPVPSITGLTVA